MRIYPVVLLLLLCLAAYAAAPAGLPAPALWLRADAGVTLDETGHVAAWLDADHDNGFIQETPESRPSFAADVLNGHPALRFDGPNGFLQLKQPIKVTDGAVFIVARWDPACLDGSARYLLGNTTGTNGYLISDGRGRVLGSGGARHYQHGVRVLMGHVGADPRVFPLANAPLSAFNIITVIGDTRPNLLFAFLGQNGQNRSRSPFLGEVAEILAFTQPLTEAQVRAVEHYLGEKYFNWPKAKTVAIVNTEAECRTLTTTAAPDRDAVAPARAPHGVLWNGRGATTLSPGRYRLHVNLTLPRDVPHLRVLARVNNTVRVITPKEQGGGASTDFTMDFIQDAANASDLPLVRLSWTTDPDPDALDPAQLGDNPAAAVRQTPLRDIAAGALLATADPYIERLCPIAITDVTADKVRYTPGEKGLLRVNVRNEGENITGEVQAKLVRNLADVEIILPPAPLALKAGEERALEVPFTATGRWGAGARVTVTADGLRENADEAFTVSGNPFEAGLGVDFGSALHTGLKRYPAAIARARASYATWLDLPGWSPGECAQLVPDTPAWYSAASSAREDDAGLQELVSLAHASGIAAVAGVSLNPAGPPAQALTTAHPEWFRKTADGAPHPLGPWDPAALQGWNDSAWRKANVHPGVMALDADWTQPALVAHVKDQLAGSVKRYGWDALHVTDLPANLPVQTLTPTRVALSAESSPTTALPPLNGGACVQEGLRFWQNGETMYRTWADFLTTERAAAARVRAAGGHYYARLNTAFLPPAQAYYKLVYSLIAGIHPADELDAPGCANWGAFLTRWSSMLWDPAITPADADKRVTVAGASLQRFLTIREVSPTQTFVILHLVTPPSSAIIGDTVFPPRPAPITVAYRPVSGARVTRVVVVRPDTAPYDTYLPKTSHITLPPLGHWAMVIWEVVK